jgi:hypothetical protein
MTYRNATLVAVLAATTALFCSTQGSWADSGCPSEASLKSEAGKQETNIAFKNQGTAAIDIYWIDYDGHRQHYSKLMPGGSQNFQTYATHPWIATDATGTCLGVWISDAGTNTVTIEP